MASFVDAPFDSPETPASEDRRIQNLDEVLADTVLDGLPVVQTLDVHDFVTLSRIVMPDHRSLGSPWSG